MPRKKIEDEEIEILDLRDIKPKKLLEIKEVVSQNEAIIEDIPEVVGYDQEKEEKEEIEILGDD